MILFYFFLHQRNINLSFITHIIKLFEQNIFLSFLKGSSVQLSNSPIYHIHLSAVQSVILLSTPQLSAFQYITLKYRQTVSFVSPKQSVFPLQGSFKTFLKKNNTWILTKWYHSLQTLFHNILSHWWLKKKKLVLW